jgi:hypothetical protein
MQIPFDQRSARVKRIADTPVGSAVIARGVSRCAVGVVLKDQRDQYANRYLLTSDDAGPHIPQQALPFVVEFGAADDLRVIVSEPLEGKAPGQPEEVIGLLGFDAAGAFVTIDARQRVREKVPSTICLSTWSIAHGTADRAYDADVFFRAWEIVMIDRFGERLSILKSASRNA